MKRADGLLNYGRWAGLGLASALMLSPNMAHAAAGSTLGNVISTFASDVWQPFWLLLIGIGFLCGLWLIATGISKLRDIGGHSNQNSALDGIMRIIGGALLVGLPDTINAGIGTFFASVTGHVSDGTTTVGGVTDCVGATGQDALTCVAQNIAGNVVPVFTEVSFCLMYLLGAGLIVHALYSLSMSHATGRAQMPKGWVARIIIGALICNTPHLITAIETTLGITSGTIMTTGFDKNSNMLAYTSDGSSAILTQYATLIGYIFQILVMFGVFSVWRGITYLRAFAEGNERGGMGPGITHIVGGVLLANGKWTVCIVLNTFVGGAMGFCS